LYQADAQGGVHPPPIAWALGAAKAAAASAAAPKMIFDMTNPFYKNRICRWGETTERGCASISSAASADAL